MCATCGCGKKPAKKSAKKPLSTKQKKIAAQAGNPNEIGADDLAALRDKKSPKKAAKKK